MTDFGAPLLTDTSREGFCDSVYVTATETVACLFKMLPLPPRTSFSRFCCNFIPRCTCRCCHFCLAPWAIPADALTCPKAARPLAQACLVFPDWLLQGLHLRTQLQISGTTELRRQLEATPEILLLFPSSTRRNAGLLPSRRSRH